MTRTTLTPAHHLAYLTAQTRMPAASVLAVRVAVALSIWPHAGAHAWHSNN